jgi:hypothetical protein
MFLSKNNESDPHEIHAQGCASNRPMKGKRRLVYAGARAGKQGQAARQIPKSVANFDVSAAHIAPIARFT